MEKPLTPRLPLPSPRSVQPLNLYGSSAAKVISPPNSARGETVYSSWSGGNADAFKKASTSSLPTPRTELEDPGL
jgi:hypothetical protein